jgi:hypothetical protein
MGEPGRLICESAIFLFSKIILIKEDVLGEPNYFLNNGIYQGFCGPQWGDEINLEPVDEKIC